MLQSITNRASHIARFALIAAFAVLVSLMLSACSTTTTDDDDSAATNRTYMSNVNRISAEAAEALEDFSTAAASDDLASMRLAAADAAEAFEELNDLEVPDVLAEVHSEYLAGAEDLNEALSAYIEVYATIQNTDADALDADQIAEDIAAAQALYDSGIGHLSDADAMVAELAGETSDDEDSDDADSASADASDEDTDTSEDA